MKEPIAYLDSSSIVKRYVEEPGSITVRNIYLKAYSTARKRFLIETRRITKLGLLKLIPVRFKLLIESLSPVEKNHVYQADALQIASAKAANATQFYTSDKKLYEIANTEGLKSTLTI